MSELKDIVSAAAMTDGNDISAGLVYIGKVLETHLRILAGIAERSADLDLRMTNIQAEALRLAKHNYGEHCSHCL